MRVCLWSLALRISLTQMCVSDISINRKVGRESSYQRRDDKVPRHSILSQLTAFRRSLETSFAFRSFGVVTGTSQPSVRAGVFVPLESQIASQYPRQRPEHRAHILDAGIDPSLFQLSFDTSSMSWLKPSNKNRVVASCPQSALMRLASSDRQHSPVALARRHTETIQMIGPVLASMSTSRRSLCDLIADAIEDGIALRACTPADHVPRGIGACLDLPTKLYSILSSSAFEGAVSWMPHGYAWKIKDLNLFASTVLPMFVDGGTYPENYNNFVRMLTSFGFKQVTRGPDTSAYYHEVRCVCRTKNARRIFFLT